ncbi:UDP-N-acetyl glucosamine 2-epimerase [Roseimaritima ulvae]|uniref:UDP-N-acetyl glucosamine 2-epimerase n=1 Tax=Roseimaritima ulvae TaxID=980254 RepID=UPI001EE41615|nr:UDP-N-acetyl glucosamine 2-epimerase [Roseimaritima ulvae]
MIAALDDAFDHVLIHTGQNYDYELNEVFFEDLGIRAPDVFLDAAGSNAAVTIGQVISKADQAFAELNPQAMLVLGDTNSCLSALAGKRRKIPVFHMEAGNRCFDQRVPEEINRKIVDHISDINMPYSDISREYLLREGLPPDRVIKTGSPMNEVLSHYSSKILASRIMSDLGLSDGEYFVVSAHREENVDSVTQFEKFVAVLNGLANKFSLPVVVSTHPRTRKRFEQSDQQLHPLIRLQKPMGMTDYVNLQMHARATLSDSGTISEESSILNFPALNIREAHERPEAMEEASVMMVGMDWDEIQLALSIVAKQSRRDPRKLRPVADYSMPNVSEKVVRIIMSYTSYINRVVWRRG